jgi:protein phosphatase
MFKRQAIGLSDTGVVRNTNQDSYYLDSQKRFFIVADGMGGYVGGKEASEISVKTISNYLEQNWNSPLPSNALIHESIVIANKEILKAQDLNPELSQMGTTVVVILFREDGSWRGHVGDSRLYRLRAGQLEKITEDHTWIANYVRRGELSDEQLRSHPWRHVLLQCLGRSDLELIEVEPLDTLSGDLLLLCSDGLTEEVNDQKISQVLADQNLVDCQAKAATLVETAKQAGGSDNITVLLVEEL